jgi:hypothetical protein
MVTAASTSPGLRRMASSLGINCNPSIPKDTSTPSFQSKWHLDHHFSPIHVHHEMYSPRLPSRRYRIMSLSKVRLFLSNSCIDLKVRVGEVPLLSASDKRNHQDIDVACLLPLLVFSEGNIKNSP